MKQTNEFEDVYEDVDGVPVSAALSEQRTSRYGNVSGLDDEELADPYELERQVVMQEWAPVLALPVRARRRWIQPTVDESGSIDFGAFGTVDFSRIEPAFDRTRYRVERLHEQLDSVLIMFGIVKERLPGMNKYAVMKHLWLGIIDLDHIRSEDMRALGMLYLRARRIQKEIARLKEAAARAREATACAFLED